MAAHIFNPSNGEADLCELEQPGLQSPAAGQPGMLHKETFWEEVGDT